MAIKGKLSMAAMLAALSLGGTLALAPNASAAGSVGSSACRFDSPDVNFSIDSPRAQLRKGPSTHYRSRGTLLKGETFRYFCRTRPRGGFDKSWSYGKVLQRTKTGIRAGTRGWVYSGHLD
ncbi:SH3 domain-containing protein [Streptomyces palmae]|uniref:SH3 domain-containing protein n=1 Tax=Streptomyces palmae TaxID=1701085 RepID=A0A4Z0GE33_9ACTN|nr:SH3 domain-containing protein [Streptomyces palmae]TGA93751.1 SH3 domain-containing protein [Streptomyces palmae]